MIKKQKKNNNKNIVSRLKTPVSCLFYSTHLISDCCCDTHSLMIRCPTLSIDNVYYSLVFTGKRVPTSPTSKYVTSRRASKHIILQYH